jgi:hypothetical protein
MASMRTAPSAGPPVVLGEIQTGADTNITDQLLQGIQLGDRTYKNHLDGYNQLALLEGRGPSARRELFYFDVEPANVVTHDDKDVGLLLLLRRRLCAYRHGGNERREQTKPVISGHALTSL